MPTWLGGIGHAVENVSVTNVLKNLLMSAQPMENPMNNNQDMFKPFHGSIDELLDHVNNKIDAGAVERIVVDKTEDVLQWIKPHRTKGGRQWRSWDLLA